MVTNDGHNIEEYLEKSLYYVIETLSPRRKAICYDIARVIGCPARSPAPGGSHAASDRTRGGRDSGLPPQSIYGFDYDVRARYEW